MKFVELIVCCLRSWLADEDSGPQPIAYGPSNQISQKSGDIEHPEPDLDYFNLALKTDKI